MCKPYSWYKDARICGTPIFQINSIDPQFDVLFD